ncbi:MAG: ATP-binding cassette domain-containing protein, partial [Vulcanimicrobiaceae bacterium]
MSGAAALTVRDLRSGYVAGIDIVQGVSLVVAPRTVSVVIGPNGAGKSTLLRTIFGLVRTRSGRIDLGSAPIEREAPHRIKQL